MTWIPESERDTSYYLFRKLFRCRVPYIQTLSADYIKQFGMPNSGDAFRNKQMANELVDRMLSIAKMVEYYENGAQVLICRHADTKVIYDHITDHLLAWKKIIEDSLNPGNPPIKDLILLDKFASAIYAHAKSHFTQEIADSLLARHMASLIGVSRDTLIPRKITVINDAEAVTVEEPKQPDRESMASIFEKRLQRNPASKSKGNGGWK